MYKFEQSGPAITATDKTTLGNDLDASTGNDPNDGLLLAKCPACGDNWTYTAPADLPAADLVCTCGEDVIKYTG